MEVTFALPEKATAETPQKCVVCHGWVLSKNEADIPVGDEYVSWAYTVDGVDHVAALHTRCTPLPDLDPEIAKKGVLKRYEMTPDMDFYGGECEVCDNDMGGNGADPHIVTEDGETLCILCAVRHGVEFTLDPETCLLTLEGHPNARYLKESDIDTPERLIKEGVWDALWYVGSVVGRTMPEYQAADESWMNVSRSKYTPEKLEQYGLDPLPDDAPMWDEEANGHFSNWADAFTRPFSRAAFKAVWAHLFPEGSKPDRSG
jgi:hypothetical protein